MVRKTPLHQSHLDASAKMVDFAGWDMPIHYGSQLNEHKIVRSDAGMFDVSHMTVVDIAGSDAKSYLRYLLANDVDKLTIEGKALYSCMLNESGGIVDDLIVYWLAGDNYRMVINSVTRDKDLDWLNQQVSRFDSLELTERDDVAMIAVQGPGAREKVLQLFDPDQHENIKALARFAAVTVGDYFVARTGYTGEDGFELLMPGNMVAQCWQTLLDAGVKPCGLGARDTLRLEAGMSLYGTDIDETTSPLVSGLKWTLAMQDDREFIGRQALADELSSGVKQQLVGLLLIDKGVLRNHLRVITEQGDGEITSGSYSPTLSRSIALARIPAGVSGEVEVEVRNKFLKAEIVKIPFVRQGKSCVTSGSMSNE
ncbi:MAG: glycine cleavage system aminomethyltransferase GcvT [Gammaproteobacteria bacterium]|nr:glycine cleavage system aminomethyltransferase GcvT [Gammaproteobacteria bacterium]